MSSDKFNISRRKFLGQASCTAIGVSTLYNSLLNLKALNAATAANSSILGGDYKALVCIFLSGGNDSFNMLVPRSNAEYNTYATTRSNLAIPQGDLLPINVNGGDGNQYGLHPSMPEVQSLFNNNKLSFVSNVGTLIESVTKNSIYDQTAKLPLGLFSHSDQIQQWQTAIPHERSAKGWGGKIADLIRDMNTNQRISMNISLSGTNVFQTGNETVEYTIDPYDGSIGIYGYRPDNMYDQFNLMRTQAIDNMLDHEYQDIFRKTYADVIRGSRDAQLEFQAALDEITPFSTTFSDNYISQSFQMIARTIGARDTLGVQRQIFFIDYGGWDHHDEVIQSQADMLRVLSIALGEFNTVLEEMNLTDCVTTFSISEFGRTLTSNGNGTDHGWGGNVMVMGGSQVNGRRMFGQYPDLQLEGELEVGGGVFIPTTAADQYFSELAIWFGVDRGELTTIFPNLENFYDTGSQDLPLGFLNI